MSRVVCPGVVTKLTKYLELRAMANNYIIPIISQTNRWIYTSTGQVLDFEIDAGLL
jgi:hypothetical protein